MFARAHAQPTVKTLFFSAVLIRSRFEVETADKIFDQIATSAPDGIEGQTAKLVVQIDSDQAAQANFNALDQLATAHPNDPLILWMVAVECRQLKKNKLGIERYNHLLQMLNPGPALVHQTLGNLYLENSHPAAALQQYDIAIQMEPAAWDYNCRGNALVSLGRLVEATAAYQKAVDLDPDYAFAWQNWARLCDLQKDPHGAAEKRAKLAEIQSRQ